MFLININNILYVWTTHYDIFSMSCIDKMSICNIDKDTLVYMWYRKIVYIRYRKKYIFSILLMYILYIHNMD